jgi:hypothetical protein
MKKLVFAGTVLALCLSVTSLSAQDTMDYEDVVLTGGSQNGHFNEWWDLTAGDITISFTYDATGLVDDASAHAWAEIGVRSACSNDFNPVGQLNENVGVWLATDYDWTPNTFEPDPTGSPSLDTDDKMILQKRGGQGEGSYDLPSTPPNPWANHAVWFDRDSVDQWQALMWGAIDGVTYNTGGTYEVVIKLQAMTDTTGEAYMTINGEPQGFYDPNWHSGPADLMPAGMTFTGDMTHLKVFYGLYGYGAIHNVAFNDISVEGFLTDPPLAPCYERTMDIKPCSDPNAINLKSKGVVPVAILSDSGFDATSVDPNMVEFAGASPVRWTFEDVGSDCGNSDGLVDLLLFFDTQELGLDVDAEDALLTGYTFSGEFVWAVDTVKLVPKNK